MTTNRRNVTGLSRGLADLPGQIAPRPRVRNQLKPLAALLMAIALTGTPFAHAQVAAESAILNSTAATRVQGVQAVVPAPQSALVRARTPAGRAPAPAATQVSETNGPSCTGGMLAPTEVRLGAGRSVLLNMPEPVVRRTLGDSQIVDSQLVSPQVLYLAAGRIGSTNAILQGQSGRCTVLNIVVGIDVEAVKTTLSELLPREKSISVTSAADSLILTGTASSALAADQAATLANAYVRSAYQQGISGGGGQASGGSSAAKEKADAGGAPLLARVVNLLGVGAPQQVMLEVKVAEVSKTVLDQYGINFSRAYALADGSAIRFLNGLLGGKGLVSGQISGTTNALVGGGVISSTSNGPATAANTAPIGNATINGDTLTIPLIAGKNTTTFGIDAQKQDGLVKVLAEPTVMAISGQEGSFLAGGKIFIPVVQNSGSGLVTYTLEEKEFGVGLRFTPTVLDDGRINLQGQSRSLRTESPRVSPSRPRRRERPRCCPPSPRARPALRYSSTTARASRSAG